VQLLHSIRIAQGANPRRLMLVGHNPGMHELALALTGHGNAAERHELARNLPTSGLAVFDFDIEDWSDVSFGRGHLATFVTPKLLKHGSDD
jgi:phosphohistidine phosphatase